jgi:hypothetical protein
MYMYTFTCKVFEFANAFNADISKWETGQVKIMSASTSTFDPLLLFMDGVADLLLFFNSPPCVTVTCTYIVILYNVAISNHRVSLIGSIF